MFRPLRALGWWRSLLTLRRSFRQGVPAYGDANGIITPETYQRLLDAWQLPDRPPPLTQFEKIADGEALAIKRMARRAALTVIENYCDGKRTDPVVKAMRDQHAKPHGVLTARFVVSDDILPEFALGVFVRARSTVRSCASPTLKAFPNPTAAQTGAAWRSSFSRCRGQAYYPCRLKRPTRHSLIQNRIFSSLITLCSSARMYLTTQNF